MKQLIYDGANSWDFRGLMDINEFMVFTLAYGESFKYMMKLVKEIR